MDNSKLPEGRKPLIKLPNPIGTDEYLDHIEKLEKELLHSRMSNSVLDNTIKELEAENEKLRKGLDIYQRERDRFKHNKPEITGEYFLAGGHGEIDDILLPQFVRIVPAYGCAWEVLYEKTDRTISYEGS